LLEISFPQRIPSGFQWTDGSLAKGPLQSMMSKHRPEAVNPSEERFRLLVESVRDYAIFMLDPQGRVVTWNPGAERFKGYKAEEIIGHHFSEFYPPEARARGLPEHELKVAAATGSFEDEGWRVRKDGSLFWANVVITALRDEDGRLLGFGKVTRDLTERRNHEEALRRSEERFRLLVEGVADYAIFMLDVNGMVATWNVGAERINGYTAHEIIGRHFSIFYPPETKDIGWPDHELQEATDKGRFVDEGWRVRKDGTRIWANVSITALRDNNGKLVGFAKLTRDLSERKRAEATQQDHLERQDILEAERNARIEAQRATKAKDEFLTTLSHELRTPLSAILGWTQILLRSGDELTSKHRRGIEVIDRNARSQVQLINDLLDLSRIMAGKIRLDIRQVALDEIVQAAVDSARPSAEAKDIRLKVMLDPTRTVVSAHSDRLQQVVWNLLSNAIKFTPKGGQVQVLLQRVNSHIELSVSDNGAGIPAEFLPQVFERFSQRDSSSTRAHGGLGLGLAISKQLVELHGGSIRAASQGEGKGSTFFVDLPVSLVQLENEQERRVHPDVPDSTLEHSPLPDLTGVHAFVVDDEPDARELIQRVLEGQGAVVACFSSADEALRGLRQRKPSVIVSDIGMPNMDGYQFMRLLRAEEARREDRTPALALTAFARPEDRRKALMAGYQAHLSKPFDVGELVLIVSDLARR
jgi:PAS domain S-box-containing protein